MARPGPKPKPTAKKLLEGTFRPDRAPKREAKPKPKLPSCPDWLATDAKREWRRIAPELVKAGLLTRLDRAALAAYCQAWADFARACRALRKGGLVQKTTGGDALSGWMRVKAAAVKEIRQLAAEFGLTPSARTRIEAEEPSREDVEEATAARLIG